jgi:hypothetical protein
MFVHPKRGGGRHIHSVLIYPSVTFLKQAENDYYSHWGFSFMPLFPVRQFWCATD